MGHEQAVFDFGGVADDAVGQGDDVFAHKCAVPHHGVRGDVGGALNVGSGFDAGAFADEDGAVAEVRPGHDLA